MFRIKPIEFLGSSRKSLAAFPDEARRTAGFQLDRVQRGLEPADWKPLKVVGPGAMELRIRDSSGAFQKKGRKTAKLDVELARVRFGELLGRRIS